MPQETNTKIYDLEERTYKFASSVRTVVKGIEFMKCFGQRCHSRPACHGDMPWIGNPCSLDPRVKPEDDKRKKLEFNN